MIDYKELITGDMPGDKIEINDSHIQRADTIFPILYEMFKSAKKSKIVVSVYGGSGVGKSEIASLLATRFQAENIGAYVVSGDNYPYRIPLENDRERENRFRYGGLRSFAASKGFSKQGMENLKQLWGVGNRF